MSGRPLKSFRAGWPFSVGGGPRSGSVLVAARITGGGVSAGHGRRVEITLDEEQATELALALLLRAEWIHAHADQRSNGAHPEAAQYRIQTTTEEALRAAFETALIWWAARETPDPGDEAEHADSSADVDR